VKRASGDAEALAVTRRFRIMAFSS
jgi:hypothetical protein